MLVKIKRVFSFEGLVLRKQNNNTIFTQHATLKTQHLSKDYWGSKLRINALKY
jgi:hypothetical protein